ncbi:undecaprenyl-diphosphate phosphatase [Acetivibrio cellulolyticus]|uniref:undecaprenyl-diphosphate phosphatase n=1 Tax=Acetivibrio cellulolyticus TaxID=35830 RepID=UPI0001E300F3|nr:undecaprenyl-diphosphate phosphatase [Acetivibrio cellulolyticus]
MNLLQAIILGIIQGLTEFLPISSSGHLSLFQSLFGLSQGSITFEVAVHLATLIAVVAVLWEDVLEMVKRPFSKLTLLVVVGTIPTVIIAVIFKDLFLLLFDTGATLGIEFIISGLILLYVEEKNKEKKNDKKLETMNYVDACVIGVAQGIAIMPAISRSGLTLAGALFRGLNREFAIKFSFLMSIPAILGSVVLEGLDMVEYGRIRIDLVPLLAGMLAAGISGYFAIKIMLKIFTKASLKYFSYYVFVVGGLIIVDQYFTRIFF